MPGMLKKAKTNFQEKSVIYLVKERRRSGVSSLEFILYIMPCRATAKASVCDAWRARYGDTSFFPLFLTQDQGTQMKEHKPPQFHRSQKMCLCSKRWHKETHEKGRTRARQKKTRSDLKGLPTKPYVRSLRFPPRVILKQAEVEKHPSAVRKKSNTIFY
jgi:hypothetical protein